MTSACSYKLSEYNILLNNNTKRFAAGGVPVYFHQVGPYVNIVNEIGKHHVSRARDLIVRLAERNNIPIGLIVSDFTDTSSTPSIIQDILPPGIDRPVFNEIVKNVRIRAHSRDGLSPAKLNKLIDTQVVASQQGIDRDQFQDVGLDVFMQVHDLFVPTVGNDHDSKSSYGARDSDSLAHSINTTPGNDIFCRSYESGNILYSLTAEGNYIVLNDVGKRIVASFKTAVLQLIRSMGLPPFLVISQWADESNNGD